MDCCDAKIHQYKNRISFSGYKSLRIIFFYKQYYLDRAMTFGETYSIIILMSFISHNIKVYILRQLVLSTILITLWISQCDHLHIELS